MITLPLSEVKIRLSSLVENLSASGKEVVITKNGRPIAMLVSLEEFDSWKETVAVRCDEALQQEVKVGLAALKAKKAKLYTLGKLFK